MALRASKSSPLFRFVFLGYCLSQCPVNALARPVREVPPKGKQTLLMIAARDQEERTRQALHALKGQLSDVPVELQLVWVDRLAKRVDEQVQAAREQVKAKWKGKKVLAVFWCDLSDPPHLYLFAPGRIASSIGA